MKYNSVFVHGRRTSNLQEITLLMDIYNRNNRNDSDINTSVDCECGFANLPKIVGGIDTHLNEFPWMVYLTVQNVAGSFFCGGSLISDRHVITAAHCVVPALLGRLRVVLGDHDRSTDKESSTVMLEASAILIHPSYNRPVRFNNDLAIVTLSNPVTFTKNIRPICLPGLHTRARTGDAVTVIGWGRTREGGPSADVLQKSDLTVVSKPECHAIYQNTTGSTITSCMVCAGSKEEKDSCQGDSGGPLMSYILGKYYLTGVVSFGYGCARPNIPGVYARVDCARHWIRRETSDGFFCL